MIEEKEVEIDGKKFILSKFPAVQGREIVSKYISANLPKVGDYRVSEEIMLKLMAYVQVITAGGTKLALSHMELVNQHTNSSYPWQTLIKIEDEMIGYNCSFFRSGRISTFLKDLFQTLPPLILKMWTALLARSSQTEKQL